MKTPSPAMIAHTLIMGGLLALSACDTPDTSRARSGNAVSARQTDAGASPVAAPSVTDAGPGMFSGRVWVVQASTAVEPGTTYAFLDDGTLVIDSPHATALYGQWTYERGAMTMTEDGVTYPVDILALDAQQFRIRSNNPGAPVEITLVPARGVALPDPEPATGSAAP